MPNISVLVPETKQSVLRPAVLDVVRQLMEITKIPPNTNMLFPDDIGKAAQPGSALSEDSDVRTIFPMDEKVVIEVQEDFDPSSVLATAIAVPEHLPIFHDKPNGVFLKPVYSKTNVVLNFKYKTSSRTVAARWRDDIKLRTSAGRDGDLVQVTYHYVIPNDIIKILKEIHRLRENVDGYGEDYNQYVLNNFVPRYTEVTNQGGTLVVPAIAETQMRIVVVYDFEGAPEKIEDNSEGEGWVASFTVKFSFDKPVAINMRYPVVIHQQVLGTGFRPKEESYDSEKQIQSFSKSFAAMHYFEAQMQLEKYVDLKAGLVLPSYDEFAPMSIPYGTVSILSGLCLVSEDDKKSLLNLNDLDVVSLDSDVLKFMKESEWPFMTKLYRSIFCLSLYKSMNITDTPALAIDSNLNIKTAADVDLRSVWRVRLGIVADLTLLDKAALDRLRGYPGALIKIINAVNEAIRNNPGAQDLKNQDRVTIDTLNQLIRNTGAYNMKTVMTTYVLSYRLDKAKELGM